MLVALFFIVLLLGPDYDFSLLNTGIYLTHGEVTGGYIEGIVARKDVLFAKEGLYGSVLVEQEKDEIVNISHDGNDYQIKINAKTFFGDPKTLKIDGYIECGTGRLDMTTPALLGGLPIILGKEGDALNIGLGCGITLGVLEKGNFETIDTAELDPIIVEASKQFNDIHNYALDDPISNLIIDDARNYLLRTDKKYDVIVSDPTHPYTSSSSNLMTREFFQLIRKHLKQDGMLVQWVPIQQLKSCDEPIFAIFYKTFSSVFPHNYAFISKTKLPKIRSHFPRDASGNINATYIEVYDYPNPQWSHGEVILVGSLKPIDIERYLDGFNESKREITEYFRQVRILDLRDHYLFSHEDVTGFAGDVGFNTDDKPTLEFLASRILYLPLNESECGVIGIEFASESMERKFTEEMLAS